MNPGVFNLNYLSFYNIVYYELFKKLLTYISHKLNWTILFRSTNTTLQQLTKI